MNMFVCMCLDKERYISQIKLSGHKSVNHNFLKNSINYLKVAPKYRNHLNLIVTSTLL